MLLSRCTSWKLSASVSQVLGYISKQSHVFCVINKDTLPQKLHKTYWRCSCRNLSYRSDYSPPTQKFPFSDDQNSPKPRLFLERLLEACPVRTQPYLNLMRLSKPTGMWLLYLPSTWAIALATSPGHWPDAWILGLFGVGAVLMRGAGCTINDLWDKDIDRAVARTKSRPLASGDLSVTQAVAFLGAQLLLAFGILLQFNLYSILVGMAALPFVLLYPTCKRWTYWPQAVLGLTFNWGTLLGYAAVLEHCNWSICLPLYCAGFSWTLIYDTIYAHQDKTDDSVIGVKSTALLFGDKTKLWLCAFSVPMATGFGLAGLNADCGAIYYCGVVLSMLHIYRQIYRVNIDNPESCWKHFKSNRDMGLILFAGIVLDRFFSVML